MTLLTELLQLACDAMDSLVAAWVAVGNQHGTGLELEQKLSNACKQGPLSLCFSRDQQRRQHKYTQIVAKQAAGPEQERIKASNIIPQSICS